MPDLEPVAGDPFSTQLQPVNGDPFANMTHYGEQPNPATPYIKSIKDFWQPPDLAPIHEPGTEPKDYLNELARNPDLTARTIEQAQPFASMGGMARPFGALSARGQLGKFELSDLHKDFQAGLNNQQIADKYNVTKEAIQQRRAQFGYPPKPRGRPWPSRLEPVSDDPFSAEKESPIVAYRKQAESIEKNIPSPAEGMTRLWRGNRPGEIGKNPSFTNDLPGIALPFQKGYGGPLSYIDVPSADIAKFGRTSGAATDAEFILPEDLASKAKQVSHPSLRQSQSRRRIEPVDFDPFAPKGWGSTE